MPKKRKKPYRHRVRAHTRTVKGRKIKVREHMRGTGTPPRPKRRPLPRLKGSLDVVSADPERDTVKVVVGGVKRTYRLKRHPSPYGVLAKDAKQASMTPEKVKINFTSGVIDPRKGKGWAAVLRKNENNEIERDFIDTDRIWGKKTYKFTFSGTYPVGTILEIAEGGSWKNKYRYFYEVTPDGLKRIGDADSVNDKMAILKRLGATRFSRPRK